MADSVETLGVALRTRTKSLGKRKSEEEEMQGEVFALKKKRTKLSKRTT